MPCFVLDSKCIVLHKNLQFLINRVYNLEGSSDINQTQINVLLQTAGKYEGNE